MHGPSHALWIPHARFMYNSNVCICLRMAFVIGVVGVPRGHNETCMHAPSHALLQPRVTCNERWLFVKLSLSVMQWMNKSRWINRASLCVRNQRDFKVWTITKNYIYLRMLTWIADISIYRRHFELPIYRCRYIDETWYRRYHFFLNCRYIDIKNQLPIRNSNVGSRKKTV